MKKYRLYIIALCVAAMGCLVSCHENIIDDSNKIPEPSTELMEVSITTKINFDDLPQDVDLSTLRILSMNGTDCLNLDGSAEIATYEGYLPQVLMLTNAYDEVILMSRADFHSGEEVVLSAHSTAVAFVTMHPALSGAKSEVYDQLVELVTTSPAFEELVACIADSSRNNISFADPSNTALTNALNKVFEQVVGASEEEDHFEELPDEGLENMPQSTRADELKGVTTIAGINVGPFYVTTEGSKLKVLTYSLTPFYSGTVHHHDVVDNFDIPSGDDRGIGFFFNKSWGSNPAYYPFVAEGEYKFKFDRDTYESYFDQAQHIFCNILEVIGIPIEKALAMNLADELVRYTIERNVDIIGMLGDPNLDGWEVTKTVSMAALEYIKDGKFEAWLLKHGAKTALAQASQAILKNVVAMYKIYESCRGVVNLVMRAAMRFNAPMKVSFELYYYQGEITTATRASIEKYSGDEQDGIVGRRLNEPIRVKVTTIGSDGSEVEASNFHRVVFELEDGNGYVRDEKIATDAEGYAQTFWILDEENTDTQYLKATVIDIVTGEKISESVTFSATPITSANVTFTLDWSPSDSNCDIDLHVYDPSGHHIWYADMTCGCGAYLDRDDRHGPGPEHIYYTDAQPGKYLVYVHHYNSDTKGTVGFVVTTEYDGRTFVNRSSVAYDEYEYIGTLEVGNTPSTLSVGEAKPQTRFYYDESDSQLKLENLPRK